MSLLNHISTAPNYGLKYHVHYDDIHGQTISLDIYKRDYTGQVLPIILYGDGIVLKKNFSDEDFFQTIESTSFELQLFIKDDTIKSPYLEFGVGDNKEFRVFLYRNEETLMYGYILPETYEEDWGAYPMFVSVMVSDSLGLLKEVNFEYPDGSKIYSFERVTDIITYILDRVVLLPSVADGGYWVDFIPLRNYLMYNHPNRGCLYDLFVECAPFYGLSCAEVLDRILSAFNAQLSQVGLHFMIYCRSYFTSVKGQAYDRLGNLLTPYIGQTYEDTYTINGLNAHGRYASRVRSVIETNIKELNIITTKEYKNLADLPMASWAADAQTNNMNFELIDEGTTLLFNCENYEDGDLHINRVRLIIGNPNLKYAFNKGLFKLKCLIKLNPSEVIENLEAKLAVKMAEYEGTTMYNPYTFDITEVDEWIEAEISGIRCFEQDISTVVLNIGVIGMPKIYSLIFIKDIILTPIQPVMGVTYKGSYEKKLTIETNNKKVKTFYKSFGSNVNTVTSGNILYKGEPNVYNNIFYVKIPSGVDMGVWMTSNYWHDLDGVPVKLETYLTTLYEAFYFINKRRFSFMITNDTPNKHLYPFSLLQMAAGINKKCYLLGYQWNLKLDKYTVEALEYANYIPPTLIANQVVHGNLDVVHNGDAVVYNG